MTTRRLAAAALAASVLLVAQGASARDYYVDALSGNDTNDGSQAHPYKTLLPLMQNLGRCDRVFVSLGGVAGSSGLGQLGRDSGDASACGNAAATTAAAPATGHPDHPGAAW